MRITLEHLGLIVGTLILSIGLGVSALYAANQDFIGVFIGFVLFVIGYKISQFAVGEHTALSMDDTVQDILSAAGLIHLLMVLFGMAMITYGLIYIFTSIQQTNIFVATGGAALIFIGYATAHYGVNNSLV